MENKRQRNLLITVGGLVLFSGGLFAYQNIYLTNKKLENTGYVFVANKDISAKTKITKDLFKPIPMHEAGMLESYVTNINEVLGKEVKGSVLKGEPLTKVRISNDKYDLKSNQLIKLEPDFVGDIKSNDIINVYVILTDKNTGEVKIQRILENKKVESQKTEEVNAVTVNQETGENDTTSGFNIRVSEEELISYYNAKTKGKIIVSKVSDLDIDKVSSVGEYTPNNKESLNAEIKDNKGEKIDNSSIIVYKVKEGDNLKNLALKFKTTEETIMNLNEGKKEFKVGSEIIVPSI